MYRYSYNGQELIIRFTSEISDINKEYLYKKITTICDSIIHAQNGSSFIVEDEKGRLAVGTIKRTELIVITIQHIVENDQIFIERKSRLKTID